MDEHKDHQKEHAKANNKPDETFRQPGMPAARSIGQDLRTRFGDSACRMKLLGLPLVDSICAHEITPLIDQRCAVTQLSLWTLVCCGTGGPCPGDDTNSR